MAIDICIKSLKQNDGKDINRYSLLNNGLAKKSVKIEHKMLGQRPISYLSGLIWRRQLQIQNSAIASHTGTARGCVMQKER